MLRVTLFMAVVATLLWSAAARSLVAAEPQKYALLIGVTKYRHAGMNEPALEFPEADARALGDLFRASGYEVDLLLGSDATQKAIRGKLEALNQKGESEGVVLVGLFGHGVEVETRDAQGKLNRDDDGNPVTEGCFCPYDTVIRFAKDGSGNPDLPPRMEPVVMLVLRPSQPWKSSRA
jgi:hypothetical protein